MPKISVHLPVYNTHPVHLRQAIDSILGQTFADFELIIVNDCSTLPHVAAAVKAYDDPRIRYLENETNLGIAATRNKMLDLSRGDYIAVMDHDDFSLPLRFETQVRLMDSRPDLGACSTGKRRFGSLLKRKTVLYPEQDEDIRAGMFFKSTMLHPGAMIRKSVLDTHGIRYDESFISGNDRMLFRDISEHARLCNIQDVLFLYRMHAGMTSRTKRAAIVAEQRRIRESYLQKMDITLTPAQTGILHDVVAQGRARITDQATLAAVMDVLETLRTENRKHAYLPVAAFDKVCATYMKKRRKSARWTLWLSRFRRRA